MDEFLSLKEVARMFRVSPVTIRRWNKKGSFPVPIRINSRGDRRYKKNDVQLFIQAQYEEIKPKK